MATPGSLAAVLSEYGYSQKLELDKIKNPTKVALEVGCGSAKLAMQLNAQGVPTLGIDWRANRRKPLSPWLAWDMATGWGLGNVLALLHLVWLAWIAIPCGTLSLVREKPIPARLRAQGVPEAPPLRSKTFLWGIPEILSSDKFKQRVTEANAFIISAFEIIRACAKADVLWLVENPLNSLLWEFGFWESVEFVDLDFAVCMHGGSRPKRQRIRCAKNAVLNATLSDMALQCDGAHQHKPWGPLWENTADGQKFAGFATQEESEYPTLFAKRMAQRLAKIKVTKAGSLPPQEARLLLSVLAAAIPPQSVDESRRKHALQRAAAGIQSRGRTLPPQIPEYKHFLWMDIERDKAEIWLETKPKITKDLPLANGTVRAGWKVLEVHQTGKGGEFGDFLAVKFAVYHNVTEFFKVAISLKHPFEYAAVEDPLAQAVFNILTLGPSEIARRRGATLARWTAWGAECADAELELITSCCDPAVAPFTRTKRPLLLHRILKETGFPAADLCKDLLLRGVPMFGSFPRTHVFPERHHVATKSVEQVANGGIWSRKSLAKMSPSQLENCDATVYKKTRAELEEGACAGPFTEEQLSARFGSSWCLARRFGVPQKSDFRPCDDYSEHGQNETSESSETVDTDDIDSIVGLARCWATAVNQGGYVHVKGRSGRTWTGRLHAELAEKECRELVARLVDLAKAYKQLAKDPQHSAISLFAVLNPETGLTEIYEPLALGFGARNAVLGFNLYARALAWLAIVGLGATLTHFFDDFSQVEPKATAEKSGEALLRMFTLLGWKFKEDADQLKDFAQTFAPLGVIVDLTQAANGAIVVSNTEKRKERLGNELSRIENQNLISRPEVESLTGAFQFADCQCMGRCGKPGLRMLRSLCLDGPQSTRSLAVRRAIDFWRFYLVNARPRTIPTAQSRPPVHVFVDASAEEERHSKVGLGAVLFDPYSKIFEVAAETVDPSAVDLWRIDDQEQIIGQAELITIPLALETWRSRIAGRNVFVWIDNDSARFSILRADSAHLISARIVGQVHALAMMTQIGMWCSRVPSASNVADWPSRGDVEVVVRAGATRVRLEVPAELADIARFK